MKILKLKKMTFEMLKKPLMFSPPTFHEESNPISPKKPTNTKI
jgi:hypothetical protein